ncbi:MAG: hypothetical protein HY852_17790 [Bradyrhizobium sp.]|uniref:hypothetical protein n=1 Tax=Bradyrhizobium sp. TaxID=376 RepID=UPI0025BD8A05|nr:hypothetical protein [Bradyrhizobium sp.]MBI5263663.1 hypothetical protein [Bradyrhizobium sp.]
MRKAAISVAAMLSALVLAIYSWRISPFLPERGGSTCFAAEYNPPRPIDLASPRRDKQSVAEVSSMKLQISLSPDEQPFRDQHSGRSYDWRYTLRLHAGMANGERLSTAAICEWSDTVGDRMVPALSCYIDCEGGSVSVWRKIGQNALSARFEAGEWLKISNGCGSGGAVYIGADRQARSLAVEAAPPQHCADLN